MNTSYAVAASSWYLPAAAWYFPIFLLFVFALRARKRTTIGREVPLITGRLGMRGRLRCPRTPTRLIYKRNAYVHRHIIRTRAQSRVWAATISRARARGTNALRRACAHADHAAVFHLLISADRH